MGRQNSAMRAIAASASGTKPAEPWNTCTISGHTSSVTSTPAARRCVGEAHRVVEQDLGVAHLDEERRQTREVAVERRGVRIAPVAVTEEQLHDLQRHGSIDHRVGGGHG